MDTDNSTLQFFFQTIKNRLFFPGDLVKVNKAHGRRYASIFAVFTDVEFTFCDCVWTGETNSFFTLFCRVHACDDGVIFTHFQRRDDAFPGLLADRTFDFHTLTEIVCHIDVKALQLAIRVFKVIRLESTFCCNTDFFVFFRHDFRGKNKCRCQHGEQRH